MKLHHYIIRRLFFLIPVLLGTVTLTFFLMYAVPSNPARMIAGPNANGEQIEKIREGLGLNQPLYLQYLKYLGRLTRGDLGRSILTRRPVLDDLLTFFPATLELTLVSMLLMIVFGIFFGVISAVKRNTLTDHAVRVFALSGVSMPIYWLGLILLYIFYFKLDLLPGPGRIAAYISAPRHITGLHLVDSLLTGNWEALESAVKHILLPAITLAYATTGMTARITRSSMLEVLQSDFIRTARAKGLRQRRIITGHALRNALVAPVTLIGYEFGYLLAGAVLTETIFDWPGLGNYAVVSMTHVDFPSVLGVVILMTFTYVFVNLAVDISYVLIDPRIRLSE